MFHHTQVVFSYFKYQILQGLTNGTLGKNKSSLPHIHIQMFFLPQSVHSKLQNTSNLQHLANLEVFRKNQLSK